MKHRVAILVDGFHETKTARELLLRSSRAEEIVEYDGQLVGWADDEVVAAVEKAGLLVDINPDHEPVTGDLPKEVEKMAVMRPTDDQMCVRASFRGPLRAAWREQLRQAGVELLGKLGPNDYRLRGHVPNLAKLAMGESLREVREDIVYEKLSPELRYETAEAGAGLATVGPQTHSGPAWSERPAGGPAVFNFHLFRSRDKDRLWGRIERPDVKVLGSGRTTIRIQTERSNPILEEAPHWPEIRYISEHVAPRLFCQGGPMAIGLSALRAPHALRWTGKDEIVAVLDSGIDAEHPDLKPAVHSRLEMSGARPVDDIGHGTHVAGIIAGRGVKGGPVGVAPGAKLIDCAMINEAEQLILPVNIDDLFTAAMAAGARIFNLSWGRPISGNYDGGSREIDEFAYLHPDVLLVVAAGNSGEAPDGQHRRQTVGTPATAKNVITVGAIGPVCAHAGVCPNSGGTWGERKAAQFPADPAAAEPLCSTEAVPALAGMSSRGPTDYNSIKPDVVAPGILIESTRSRHAPMPGAFDEGCPLADKAHYCCLSGTSMAAPFVAGAAALFREFARGDLGQANPSSSLLKALLIAAATRRAPIDADRLKETGVPDFDQGFGVLDLASVLPHAGAPAARCVAVADVANNSLGALASRQLVGSPTRSYCSYSVKVKTGEPLRIVLCWTDAPGAYVQNNLQLQVLPPDAGWIRGNAEHTFLRSPFEPAAGDKWNTVERIILATPAAGEYRIRVFAQNTSAPNQGYALAVVGALDGSLVQTSV